MIIIANAAVFIAFSIFIGIHILEIIPKEKRPMLRIPSFTLPATSVVMIVFSFLPVGVITEQAAVVSSDPFPTALIDVLFDYTIGQGFIAFLLFLAITLAGRFVLKEKRRWLLLIPSIGMVFGWAWSSHAAAFSNQGFLFDALHISAAAAWTGVLLVIGFLSIGEDRWLSFFDWFTPFAITMVSLLFVSGLGMLFLLTPEYTNSWMLSYGQWQLLKHLLFLPLVFYGFAHGFLMKKRLENQEQHTPRFSLQMESAVLVVVFIVTAIMADQEPPHEVAETLEYTETSGIAAQMIDIDLATGETVTWSASVPAVLLGIAALFTLFLCVYSIGTGRPFWLAPVFIALFVAAGYFAIMIGADVEAAAEVIRQRLSCTYAGLTY
ncbi:hypothetical protein EPH95_16915 [Salicibibacter halophilus]|uniref:Copper resistance protein D domain-containing protein n=1 Tax=Salicibibacter halophilus TaxID=2502791 RepID=A0A514LM95_9BACI|nr:CopD family protein [Salicibibacter halophilus]QDI92655.1 hypothetical protein EPH95_16915 [Salicibibacter halophilus]